jgi:2-dehydropantoate 2-reductase
MTTITLIGPGAIGLCAGAALMDKGHEVTFAGRQGFDLVTVKTEEGVFRRHVAKAVIDGAAPPADWVLVCVKAHQTMGAADAIRSAIGPATRVAVLQNGVEHAERLAPILPGNVPVVPVVVDIPAGRLGRGEVLWRGRAGLLVQDTVDGRDFCTLFAGTFVTARTVDDLKTRMWRKLCVNAPSGAILCLTGRPMEVFHAPGIADLARAILRECVAVAQADGANLGDDVIEAQMQAFLDASPDETNSMFDDFIAGHETEWDARNGVLVRKGAQHGVDVPVSRTLAPLLAALRREAIR